MLKAILPCISSLYQVALSVHRRAQHCDVPTRTGREAHGGARPLFPPHRRRPSFPSLPFPPPLQAFPAPVDGSCTPSLHCRSISGLPSGVLFVCETPFLAHEAHVVSVRRLDTRQVPLQRKSSSGAPMSFPPFVTGLKLFVARAY